MFKTNSEFIDWFKSTISKKYIIIQNMFCFTGGEGWHYTVSRQSFIHYVNGKAHNIQGPAFYSHDIARYILNGVEVEEQQWAEHPGVIQTKLRNILNQ